MGAFFTKLWNGLKALVQMIVPFVGRARQVRGIGTALRWTVAVVFALAVALLLYLSNQHYGWVPGWLFPTDKQIVRSGWLSVLWLLLYSLGWLIWWLWLLLLPEEETSDFPDIDAAWDEAVRALDEAGLGLTELPLFLVLGRPAGGEDGLFHAAQLNPRVPGAPRRAAPLHVYANAEGIYLTCAGASLLGRLSAVLAAEVLTGEARAEEEPRDGELASVGAGADPYKTMAAADAKSWAQQRIQAILRQARVVEQRELTGEEQQEINRLMRQDNVEHARQVRASRPSLLKDVADVERCTARLRHLCRLVVRDRRPYCPINGVVLLLPLAAADSDEDANQSAEVCRRDVQTARQALKVHCPVLALVCDLETVPGFDEFIARVPGPGPSADRLRRVGQRFPLVPNADGPGVVRMVETGVHWLCHSMFASWVYRLFRLESPGKDETEAVTRGNAQLYRMLSHLLERQPRLGRILTRGLAVEQATPLLFAGCYLAATGRDPAAGQAFVAGVLRRFTDPRENLQNFVSWTEEALAEEASYQRWTRIGYAVLGALAVAAAGAVGFYFYTRGRRS